MYWAPLSSFPFPSVHIHVPLMHVTNFVSFPEFLMSVHARCFHWTPGYVCKGIAIGQQGQYFENFHCSLLVRYCHWTPGHCLQGCCHWTPRTDCVRFKYLVAESREFQVDRAMSQYCIGLGNWHWVGSLRPRDYNAPISASKSLGLGRYDHVHGQWSSNHFKYLIAWAKVFEVDRAISHHRLGVGGWNLGIQVLGALGVYYDLVHLEYPSSSSKVFEVGSFLTMTGQAVTLMANGNTWEARISEKSLSIVPAVQWQYFASNTSTRYTEVVHLPRANNLATGSGMCWFPGPPEAYSVKFGLLAQGNVEIWPCPLQIPWAFQ